MKVIDLLNKIANGEEVPKKYRYRNTEYKEDYCYMLYEATGDCNELGFKSLLNDEVEIIEEHKIPKKLENYKSDDDSLIGLRETINIMYDDTSRKINEILDYLEEIE